MKKIVLVGWIFVFLVSIGILFVGIWFIMNKDKDVEKLVQMANPLTEVKNTAEMKDYLGYDIPIMTDKEVSKYIVVGDGKYANHGRIIYNDESQFDIEKGDSDVSGIYGGVKKREESISGTKIVIYSYEDTIYAIWNYNNYSYSYSMKNSDDQALLIELNKLMKLIK